MGPLALLALTGCPGEPADTGVGLLGTGWLDPFPSALLVDTEGNVAIPLDAVPVPDGGTALPVDRFSGWRTGFSRGQVAVVRLPDVDPTSLPDWRVPTPGEGGVLLYDRDTGEFLPVFAEVDTHPDAASDPTLLIRPLAALPDGHRVAVVVTTAVAARPDRFDALVTGAPPASLVDWEDHFVGLLDEIEGLGVSRDTVALAFDFPVDGGTAPLVGLLADLPDVTVVIDEVRTADDDDRVAPHTWRAASGSFTLPDVLIEDRFLRIDPATGAVSAEGTREHPLYVHIPDSVKDAPEGTVPVLIFGHGIFATPEQYLDSTGDDHGVLALLDELGAIAIAMPWYGLSGPDRLDALGAAADFGQLPLVPDRLVETNAALRALIASLDAEGGLLDHEALRGRSGQRLADPDRLLYYGISAGGIEGAVQVGSGAPFDAAVLHVGGSMWSTMLERSTQWPPFELFVEEHVASPAERQQLYALSQLFWDPVDPIAWTDGLAGAPALLQESLGDEQVANLGTRALARSGGAIALTPGHRHSAGPRVERRAHPRRGLRVVPVRSGGPSASGRKPTGRQQRRP
jgi:hypothetical protein